MMSQLDTAVPILLGCALVLFIVLSQSSRPELSRTRIAYLGYAVAALVIGWFQLHLYVDGPDAFMFFGIFLFPIAVAAGIAIFNTFRARSRTLRILRGATLALVLFQVLAGFGIFPAIMNLMARAYVVLVLIASVAGYRDWWPPSERSANGGS